jgi:hypothetical protein
MNKREMINAAVEKDKLENIFVKKYRKLSVGLVLNTSHLEHTWHVYLNSIGCTRLLSIFTMRGENYKDTFEYLIRDPSYYGGYIQIPNETALKILVLGDLP